MVLQYSTLLFVDYKYGRTTLFCRQGIEAWIEGQISVWHKNIWTKKLKYREDKNVAISTIASFEYDTVRLYPQ